ncbi:conserved hypothetical protein [Candidatus Methylobacter favarea]|uniref:SPOR domain-containing protein n=1 Tax=Candidatus Methylobacter favarea TaxID=2707345 RepID=A0A8S0YAY2_9GAMM|nr:SPOR domain-containing protein [Candidatus Methylobacter favarea]CAA9892757.1 conserved hypothetical protein [Candidatus Methylobacter favarea]
MNQELKQRLIGALVITALAAIFVPMLFDDPVDNSGRMVSEMTIPEAPVNSAEDTAAKLPADADEVLKNSDDQNLAPPEEAADISVNKNSGAEEVEQEGERAESEEKSVSSQAATAEPADSEISSDTAGNANAEEEAEPPVTPHRHNIPKQAESSEPLENESIEEIKKPVKVKKTVIPSSKSKPKQSASLKPVEPGPIAAVKKTVSAPKVTSPKPVPELVRWYLQAGSFAKKENALALWESIRKQGLPVMLETIQVAEKGALYRLKLGPELDKDRAIAMQARLNKQNIKTILVSE